MENRISSIINVLRRKTWTIIICGTVFVVMIIGGFLVVSAQSGVSNAPYPNDESAPEWSTYNNLSDFTEALQNIGLTFIDINAYLSTTDDINWYSTHIGRLAEDIPIIFTSKDDVDLLLAIMSLIYEQQISGLSWDPCVDEALAESGFEDYLRDGIREITRESREKQMIYLATNFTLEELIEMGLFLRSGIVKEFHELGFFLDLPEDFETSMEDFDTGWAIVNGNDY